MNDFKRSLKVEVDKRQEVKVEKQKEDLNNPFDRVKMTEELIRKLNEEVWEK